jgi:hypothetical protein
MWHNQRRGGAWHDVLVLTHDEPWLPSAKLVCCSCHVSHICSPEL